MTNAVSELDLANMALAKLTKDRIRDPEGKEPGAIHTKAHMRSAIHEFIEEFDWPESRVLAPLVPIAGEPAPRGYTGVYAVPADMLALWWLGDITRRDLVADYELGMSADLDSNATYIYTNQTAPYIRYGSSRTTLNRFSAKQIDLIALNLAIKCCLLVGQDKRYRQGLQQEYDKNLSKLQTLYARREPELIPTEDTPELIRVRSE